MSSRGSTAIAEFTASASPTQTWTTATPLTPVGFYPKSGLLPAVVEVRNQTGNWDAPGQTRQLMLSDGGAIVIENQHGIAAANALGHPVLTIGAIDHGIRPQRRRVQDGVVVDREDGVEIGVDGRSYQHTLSLLVPNSIAHRIPASQQPNAKLSTGETKT